MAKTRDIVGYITSDNKLTNWKGKDLGWRVYDRKVRKYTLTETGEASFAVVLIKSAVKKKDRWAGGYYLGDAGDLFRGEEFPTLDDAEEGAVSLSEYWSERDYEDYLRDQEEYERDQEEYED